MQALCGGDRLAMLLERAFLTRDELLFKVLRNLSQQQADVSIKAGFLPYMDKLISLLQVHPLLCLIALFSCLLTCFTLALPCSLAPVLCLLIC